MRPTTLRENLALLHELEEAAGNVCYGIDEVQENVNVMANMFYTQVRNFVNDMSEAIINKYNHDKKD